MNLFVYGTLLDPDIMRVVCGESLPGTDASLPGFRCRKVINEAYPAILPAEGEMVSGKICFDVSAGNLRRLDRYEGEQYGRREVMVVTAAGDRLPAQAYLLADGHEHELGEEDWCLAEFFDRYKKEYLPNLKKQGACP